MVAEVSVILLLLIVLLVLIFLLGGRKGPEKGDEWVVREEESESRAKLFGTRCPLCGEWLNPGERVHSHLYPGKPDGLMHIFGCPRCYQGHPDKGGRGGSGRICPYCKESLGPEDYVIARVFQKPGKTQVHVLGCTICRERR